MGSALPGVNVGPLDPDKTAEFGQVGGTASARTLVRLHAQAFPQVLVRALALKQDVERSRGLDMEEVRDYLAGVTLDNGDPAVPDNAEVVGAAVRGARDRGGQVLTYTIAIDGESGRRTTKWFAPYDPDGLPNSFAEGTERVRLSELREKGLVATETTATPPAKPRRASKPKDEEEEQVEESTAADEPPVEGYDELKADDLKKLVKDEDTSPETVQAILDYESAHQDRRTVVGAANERLGVDGRA